MHHIKHSHRWTVGDQRYPSARPYAERSHAISMSLFSDLWAKAHGRHLAIAATTTGASLIALLASVFHLVALRPLPGWEEVTGVAIAVLVLSTLVLLSALPTFLRLRGHVLSLEEIMATTSLAERRRRRSEGDAAAKELGGGWEERWRRFLEDGGR